MASALSFSIHARSRATRARRGTVTTPHGTFDTPAFMPVGTRGTVKGVLPHMLAATGAQICLGNTYHLLLRPGPDVVARLGGLHALMNWPGPILTDSGGYQAYSMADINSITDDGVTFRSIIDGSKIHLSPEESIQVQNKLGADIIMAFDDCPPSSSPEGSPSVPAEGDAESARRGEESDDLAREEPTKSQDPRLTRVLRRDRVQSPADYTARLKVANERTVRWLERCKRAHGRAADQALIGIVQGGTDFALRSWSAEHITNIDLPGYAIGGVAVGESGDDIRRIVQHTAPLLPEGKPRYLMGVGYERDILAAVRAGVDMFDCVLPTRNARNANAFTPTGQMRLRNARFTEDRQPIEAGCDCLACAGTPTLGQPARPFTRAYLRHLFMADEMLGPILVTLHNLRYFQRFMADLRATIESDDWAGLVTRYPCAANGLN